MFYMECMQVIDMNVEEVLQCTGICSRISKYILNYSKFYFDWSRKEFSTYSNRMIYPVQNFSNGAEDTVEKATFFSNNLP
jgi:hypothetical protein